MAVVRPPPGIQLYGPSTNQRRLLTAFKVPINTLNHVLYSTRAPSISCNSKFQNFSCSLQFQNNSFQESIVKDKFLFDQPKINVSLGGKMIKEYTDDGYFDDAIRIYIEMLEYGVPVGEFRFFPCLIKAFGGLCDVEKGRQIHGHVLKLGFLDDLYIVNALLGMYWKCGEAADAVRMFEKMRERDLVSWNTMVSGFQQSMCYADSLMFFSRMMWEFGMSLNRVGCISALSSSASLESLIHGREIHAFVIKFGLHVDDFLVSGLIGMYMKCGSVKNAEHVFKSIPNEDLLRGNRVIWNVMILGYVSNGCLSQAFVLFLEMLVFGIIPDSSTIVAVLGLCSQMLDFASGRQIHGIIFSFGLENDVKVETALLDMYFKCGDIEAGLKVFRRSQNDNLVMWGAAISNCAQSGYPTEALELFHSFSLDYGSPDCVMLLSVLRACSSLSMKPKGMEIHGLAVKMGFDSDLFVGSALIDMYAKCRDIESAQKMFGGLQTRDLVSWNALISGYAQNECPDESLKAFRDMQSEHIRPNAVMAACILSVCAHLSVKSLCKEIHGYLTRQGFESNVLVSNSLIATYAKCGDLSSSKTIFEKMPGKNNISWNSIILGFGMHGNIDEMFVLFEKMKAAGMKPDHATSSAILSACSHAGRVDKGWEYFNSMVEEYKLEPQLEHFTCMVDLLGRAGHLNQAYDLIMAMPCIPDDRIWGSLLRSCKTHSDEKLARLVANHIFELDHSSIGYRVLLANLYEGLGKWDEASGIRSEIKDLGLKKTPGCSWVEVNNNIHIFIASDQSHYQSQEIYATIESLTTEIKRAGYVPQLHPIIGGLDDTYEEGLHSSEDNGLFYMGV
ncbi:hypothetical protein L1049_027584 [Liquidambar formosana]|uniref:Pentatricopeptide repeat-containing protein n=1 Tax=Liquidambar formosana TaxID=63359 RepID=A0AAP0RJ10_LIQFO